MANCYRGVSSCISSLCFQSLEGSQFFSLLPHVVFVHSAGIRVSDHPFRPNQIVKEAAVLQGCTDVSQPCLATEPSRQRKKGASSAENCFLQKRQKKVRSDSGYTS